MSERHKNPEKAEMAMIEEILDNFDFHKCSVAMKSLGWGWGFERTPPTIERLKESASKRLQDAIVICKQAKCHKSTYYTSSGGLKGSAWKNKYGHIEAIQLEFVLTDWQSDGDY